MSGQAPLDKYQRYRRSAKGRATASRFSRTSRVRIRRQVISVLGGACACCGENRDPFLEVDHVLGDGHLEGTGSSQRYYKALREISANRGARYQVLCANCHAAKTRGVVCPHREESYACA